MSIKLTCIINCDKLYNMTELKEIIARSLFNAHSKSWNYDTTPDNKYHKYMIEFIYRDSPDKLLNKSKSKQNKKRHTFPGLSLCKSKSVTINNDDVFCLIESDSNSNSN